MAQAQVIKLQIEAVIMFDFLLMFLTKSVFTNSIELILQSVLLFAINRFAKTKTALWETICKHVSLFLFLESICQLIYSINSTYIGWNIPFFVKIGILAIASIPLFTLWIDLPELLLKYRNASPKELKKSRKKEDAKHIVHSEVTNRLINSLRRIDKNYVVSS